MNMYSLGEVVKQLGIKRHRLTYALAAHNILPDVHKIGGNRIFTEEDVETLRRYFEY